MDVSVSALLPEAAKKPLDKDQVEMIARGLLRPNAGIVQRLAIELIQAEAKALERAAECIETHSAYSGYAEVGAIHAKWIRALSAMREGEPI